VLIEMDNKPLANEAAYREALRPLRIGDTVTLTVVREGQRGRTRLRLGEAP
jgi:S1-C subfamily serine protease